MAMPFRDDINLLRALAVTLVVFFHYDVAGFAGGYVGVDVFFVISGYLMTKIIVGEIETGRFSLLAFYRARLLRILPPLLGLTSVILVAGYWLADAEFYRRMATEIVAALTFTSNVLFWRQSDYFSGANEGQILLHTWSLSVEWQFYLLYPLALMLIVTRCASWKVWLTPLLWLGLLLSLSLCIVLSWMRPEAAFFFIPARAWEMLAGGLVLLHVDRANLTAPYPRALAAIGVLLILVAATFFDKSMSWPSYHAVLPVFGACLVIAARAPAESVAMPAVSAVGRWSYSIYLWHWPILIAVIYMSGSSNIPLMFAALFAVIGGAALAKAIARRTPAFPTRQNLLTRRQHVSAALAGGAMAAACAMVIVWQEGMIWRHKNFAQRAELYRDAQHAWSFPSECSGTAHGRLRLCEIGNSDDRTLVIGDSHAESLFPRFLAYAEKGHAATFATARACLPIPGMVVIGRRNCTDFAELALGLAREKRFKRVIILALWKEFLGDGRDRPSICFITPKGCVNERDAQQRARMMTDALTAFAARLKDIVDAGTPVFILGPEPGNDIDLPMELLRRDFLGRDDVDLTAGIPRSVYEKERSLPFRRLAQIAQASGSRLIDPAQWLCESDRCPTMDAAGRPVFRDANHFTRYTVTSSRFGFVDEAMGARLDESLTLMQGR